MEIKVWIDHWQMQCCGRPFAVGGTVSWTAREPDSEWLSTVLGADDAATIDVAQEQHTEDPDGLLTIEGSVSSIVAVRCRYAPRPHGNPKTLYPVAGSGTLTHLESADGWTPDDGDMRFAGYIAVVITDRT